MKRRPVRTVLLGVLVGLCASFGYVSLAQTSGVPLPLVTALQAAAAGADVELVVALDGSGAEVYLPTLSDDWHTVLVQLALVHGLTVCELGPRTLLVTDSPHAAVVCGGTDEEQPDDGAAGEVDASGPRTELPAPEEEPGPVEEQGHGSVVYRVRVLQLDEARAQELGLDWGAGVFDLAGRLVVAGYQAMQGLWPSVALGDMVRFLESEGVAVRVEDVELRTRGGETVTFQRGGTINVNLVGGGDATISQRYNYGLTLDLTGTLRGEVVELAYTFVDAAPGNVSDPRNVQLSNTSASGRLDVPCGFATVLAGIGSRRESVAGEGLPVLASVPGAGYAFGVSTVNSSRVAYVVTVDVGCPA